MNIWTKRAAAALLAGALLSAGILPPGAAQARDYELIAGKLEMLSLKIP